MQGEIRNSVGTYDCDDCLKGRVRQMLPLSCDQGQEANECCHDPKTAAYIPKRNNRNGRRGRGIHGGGARKRHGNTPTMTVVNRWCVWHKKTNQENEFQLQTQREFCNER